VEQFVVLESGLEEIAVVHRSENLGGDNRRFDT